MVFVECGRVRLALKIGGMTVAMDVLNNWGKIVAIGIGERCWVDTVSEPACYNVSYRRVQFWVVRDRLPAARTARRLRPQRAVRTGGLQALIARDFLFHPLGSPTAVGPGSEGGAGFGGRCN
jgi:hypothetical protein